MYYFGLFHLGHLLWFCSFICDILSFLLLSKSLCLFLYGRKVSYISCLTKRRCVVPCSAVSLVHQNLVLQRWFLCVLLVPCCCGWAAFAFHPVICNGSFFACYQPCLFSFVLWAKLGLPWDWVASDQPFAWVNISSRMQDTLFVLSPEKLLLVNGACSQTRGLYLAHCSGHSWSGVCSYPPLFLSQFAVMLPPVGVVCTLPGFGWALAKKMLEGLALLRDPKMCVEGRCSGVAKVCLHLSSRGGDLHSLGLRPARLERADLKCREWGRCKICSVSKWQVSGPLWFLQVAMCLCWMVGADIVPTSSFVSEEVF